MSFAATWMDLEIITLNEVKSDRERQISCDITYMWSLIKEIQKDLFIKQKQTQILKSNLWLPKGKLWREGINWENGINIYTLLYIK